MTRCTHPRRRASTWHRSRRPRTPWTTGTWARPVRCCSSRCRAAPRWKRQPGRRPAPRWSTTRSTRAGTSPEVTGCCWPSAFSPWRWVPGWPCATGRTRACASCVANSPHHRRIPHPVRQEAGQMTETTAPPAGPVAPAPRRGWYRRAWDVVDDRMGISALRYPVPEHANNVAWSLGGITAAMFVVLIVTGVILVQFYNPTPEGANASVRDIEQHIWLGSFIRGIHFWAAQAMYVTAALHLLRVFFTGSYKKPREGNWLLGVAMFGLTILALFTGTVLKWDQEGYEALSHNIEVGRLLGGAGSPHTRRCPPTPPAPRPPVGSRPNRSPTTCAGSACSRWCCSACWAS